MNKITLLIRWLGDWLYALWAGLRASKSTPIPVSNEPTVTQTPVEEPAPVATSPVTTASPVITDKSPKVSSSAIPTTGETSTTTGTTTTEEVNADSKNL